MGDRPAATEPQLCSQSEVARRHSTLADRASEAYTVVHEGGSVSARAGADVVQHRRPTKPRRRRSRSIREAAKHGRADRLPAGALPLAVLLPARRRAALRSGRAHPRADAPSSSGGSPRKPASSSWRRSSSGARPGVYHNTAVVIDADGTLAGLYRKMHIPDDPLYYEKYYFTPGDLGFRAFDTALRARSARSSAGTSGTRRRARLTALQGADCSSTRRRSAGIPTEKAEYGAAQHDAWETIQRSHAIANGVFVAAVNRVGHEGADRRRHRVLGRRRSSPTRSACLLAKASHDKEEILVVECDPARIEEVRRNWPFLRDRRIDAYDGLTRRWLE